MRRRFDIVGLALRMATIVAYCWLALSGLLIVGLLFGGAFLSTFTIENGLDEPIRVTPIGAVGPSGSRQPLPVAHRVIRLLPASVRGGYELQPHQSVTLTYDMDDINFSEIVVESGAGWLGQLMVNADPTANRYHAPAEDHFLVHTASLVPALASVIEAAKRAKEPCASPGFLIALMVAPWPIVCLLSWVHRKHVERLGFGEPSQG